MWEGDEEGSMEQPPGPGVIDLHSPGVPRHFVLWGTAVGCKGVFVLEVGMRDTTNNVQMWAGREQARSNHNAN